MDRAFARERLDAVGGDGGLRRVARLGQRLQVELRDHLVEQHEARVEVGVCAEIRDPAVVDVAVAARPDPAEAADDPAARVAGPRLQRHPRLEHREALRGEVGPRGVGVAADQRRFPGEAEPRVWQVERPVPVHVGDGDPRAAAVRGDLAPVGPVHAEVVRGGGAVGALVVAGVEERGEGLPRGVARPEARELVRDHAVTGDHEVNREALARFGERQGGEPEPEHAVAAVGAAELGLGGAVVREEAQAPLRRVQAHLGVEPGEAGPDVGFSRGDPLEGDGGQRVPVAGVENRTAPRSARRAGRRACRTPRLPGRRPSGSRRGAARACRARGPNPRCRRRRRAGTRRGGSRRRARRRPRRTRVHWPGRRPSTR